MFSQHLISSTTPTLSRRRQNQRSRASEIARCQIPPRRAAEQQTDYARNDIPDPNAAAAPPRSVSADCVSAIPVGSASPREPAAGPPALRAAAPSAASSSRFSRRDGDGQAGSRLRSARRGAEAQKKSLYFPPAPRPLPAAAGAGAARGTESARTEKKWVCLSDRVCPPP